MNVKLRINDVKFKINNEKLKNNNVKLGTNDVQIAINVKMKKKINKKPPKLPAFRYGQSTLDDQKVQFFLRRNPKPYSQSNKTSMPAIFK